MDFNEYTLAALVRTRLDEARALAARRRLAPRRRARARARLGEVLIALGHRLVEGDAAARARVEPSHA
jgi:hypothetical protein